MTAFQAPAADRSGAVRQPVGVDEPLLLAGDVGGTKTMLALVDPGEGRTRVVAEATFASREFATLEDAVDAFRQRNPAPVGRAAFSVAGPVLHGRARITNLPWLLDAEGLRAHLNASHVLLVNDLQATANAIPHLGPDQLATLREGTADPNGVRGVVAVGTGLGEAMLVPTPGGFEALPTEGGHTDFAPRGALQRALLAFLQREFEHVSYERVCSGHGIPNLYRFLAPHSSTPAPPWLTDRLAAADDPTPVIVEAGLRRSGGDAACRATLRVLAAILGAEAGNVALRMLATGGVYIGGGIPPRILPALRSRAFLEGFRRKGPMSQLVGRIPVHVILEPRAALLGAARYGLAMA